MKKGFLIILVLFSAIVANATNYKVTVSTMKYIQYKVGSDVIDETKEKGQTTTYNVTADTPDAARQIAMDRCSLVCNTDIYQLEQRDIHHNGKLCDRYALVVPYEAKVEVETKSTY